MAVSGAFRYQVMRRVHRVCLPEGGDSRVSDFCKRYACSGKCTEESTAKMRDELALAMKLRGGVS
jgi:hypothetical protein